MDIMKYGKKYARIFHVNQVFDLSGFSKMTKHFFTKMYHVASFIASRHTFSRGSDQVDTEMIFISFLPEIFRNGRKCRKVSEN